MDAELLPLLARLVDKEDIVYRITMKGIRGEIEWEEGLRQRIEAIRGIRYEDALRVADAMPYMGGAREVCRELKGRGYALIGVTGGFAILADRVKRELGLNHVFSNELVFDEGLLSGVKRLRVTSKEVVGLEGVLRRIGAKKENIVVVVDGANDMKLFEYAGTRIAFNAQWVVKQRADVIINTKDLRDILKYI